MEWALIGFQLLCGFLAGRSYSALPLLDDLAGPADCDLQRLSGRLNRGKGAGTEPRATWRPVVSEVALGSRSEPETEQRDEPETEQPAYARQVDGVIELGHVSIIVPARNEAARIGPLLRSLDALRYPSYEVLVVDDGSNDGTGDVAARHGARVLRISGPPPGWTGKAYACEVGAGRTSGEWLLFTDADTVHGPESLPLAVTAAVRSGASLVSLLARQECRTFWEKLLLPYAYALYFVGASGANRPGGPAIANGQYMLFRRASYAALGGHAAVRGSIVEDVSLAQAVRHAGMGVLLLRGEEHLSVRMYGGLRELWEGFGKNAFRFVTASPRSGLGTVAATLAFDSALPFALRTRSRPARLGLLLAPALGLLSWQRRFGVSRRYALLHPLAGGVFQVIALHSMWRALSGRGADWKGRHY